MSSTKALRTNSNILQAARDVLRTEGIERLSMDRVAAKAGVSKGAVMYHFPTKRALQAALIQDYADHLDSGLKKHEAMFEGSAEEVLIPAYIEWFKSFSTDNNGWASVGVQILGQQAMDPELLKPISDWYQKLYTRIEQLPEKQRTPMLMAVMTMEGFFFVHKFGLDTMNEELKESVLKALAELTATTTVARKKV
ncbi:MAG: TetR/AcrR family transcriptional regulator [Sutterellaceae bacterium]|nr:TetR/AcrR family transcriptional regulator [Sutterellaceae bacterium]